MNANDSSTATAQAQAPCECATAPGTGATAPGTGATAGSATAPVSKVQPLWHARKTEDGATLEVALPGVTKENLELTTGRNFLRLEARRKATTGAARVVRGEPAPEVYHLELRLAANLDGSNTQAKFEDGVLLVTLPLAEAAKPRRIEVG